MLRIASFTGFTPEIGRSALRRAAMASSKRSVPFRAAAHATHKRLFHSSRIARMEDPYEVSGVPKTASAKEIKKKYYQSAKQYHPDINKESDADKKFQAIQSSYEISSDEKKRAQYDQMGAAAFEGGAGAGGHQGGDPFGGFNPFGAGGFGGFGGGGTGGFGSFEDIFSAFTGQSAGGAGRGRGAGQQIYKGEDLEVLVQSTLEEAAKGVKKQVNYSVIDECHTCHGSGLKSGKSTQTCGTCHGTGTTVHSIQGGFQMASTCPTCHGSGVVIPRGSECGSCHGEGTEQDVKRYEVDIPAGIRDGMRIREMGEGDSPQTRKAPGISTAKGDLYVRIAIKPHQFFKRQGDDLMYKASIPFTTASLGGKLEIPTSNGPKLRINVPSGSQFGDEIVIPGQGMPMSPLSAQSRMSGGSARGNLKINLNIRVPRPENETQTVLLEAFADAVGDKNARRKYKPLDEIHDEAPNTEESSGEKQGSFKRSINKVLKHGNK